MTLIVRLVLVARRARARTKSVARHTAQSSRYGTASCVASASRALPAAPAPWPIDHPRFESANAKPWAIPTASAPSDSSAIDGAHSIPIDGAASSTSAITCQDRSGHGKSSISTAPATSAIRHGYRRPRRSDTRPTTGLTPVSSAAAPSQAAPITAAPTPRSSSRSGASTPIVPNISPGTTISHIPAATRPSRSASSSSRGDDVPSGSAGGVRSAHSASAVPTTATPQNVGVIPTASARAPTAGPTSAPATAAPIVVPIISPRRSRGAALATQAIAPAHDAAPPMPCRKRAASRATIESANANPRLETTISPSPSSTVARTPARAAR